MRLLTIFIFLLTIISCSHPTKQDRLISQLRSADFSDVCEARDSLLNYDNEIIPNLIELLSDTSFVKLKNTADLIYPGADEFYGHGWIVNYDLDWISERAAWLLEEITFQDFGYEGFSIREDSLMQLQLQNYESYLQSESHQINFKDKTPRQQLIVFRQILADSVLRWWNTNKNSWSRFKAIKDGLASSDETRQRKMLQYLLYRETACQELTFNNYEKQLKPLVQKIERSKNSQSELAKLLLEDSEFSWLKIKLKKTGS